mmetsp:Transcript_24278/g.37423  ORF Transcript_24278/g.37423 Transcript_24278/m.37423 type:complete len:292 (-) Transcript_24278:352-1227(-)
MGTCRSLDMGQAQTTAVEDNDVTTAATTAVPNPPTRDPQQTRTTAVVSSSSLPPSFAEVLSKVKVNSPSFVELDLRSAQLGNEGLCSLTQALQHNTNLKVLLLSDNGIVGGEGILPLAKLLSGRSIVGGTNVRHNGCGIEELDLQGNQLGDSGSQVIADLLLPHNTTLRELYVPGNSFSDQGKQLLLEGLTQNYFLHHFVIRNDSQRLVLSDAALHKQINFYLRLNRAGRRILRDEFFNVNEEPPRPIAQHQQRHQCSAMNHPNHNNCPDTPKKMVPAGLWAYIFARVSQV